MLCTVVRVHGAFSESASSDRVIDPLAAEGHRVVATANPLRDLAADAAAISDLVGTIEWPVALVAHSCGGAVIFTVDRPPAALERYMPERARVQRTVAVEGASHAIAVSRPDATVHLMLEAAALRAAA
jgi:alpha-beta hydrolase superfamily lysophospholipase